MNPTPPLAAVPPATPVASPLTKTKIEAALESAWVTFVAVAGGFWIAGVAAGATTPAALLVYLKAHWVAWLATNMIAPAIRFYRQAPPAA